MGVWDIKLFDDNIRSWDISKKKDDKWLLDGKFVWDIIWF